MKFKNKPPLNYNLTASLTLKSYRGAWIGRVVIAIGTSVVGNLGRYAGIIRLALKTTPLISIWDDISQPLKWLQLAIYELWAIRLFSLKEFAICWHVRKAASFTKWQNLEYVLTSTEFWLKVQMWFPRWKVLLENWWIQTETGLCQSHL